LRFGIVSDAADGADGGKHAAVAFEDKVIDLDCLVHDGVLDAESLLGATSLNDFLGEGLPTWRAVRARLQHLLGGAATSDERAAVAKRTHPRSAVMMHLPVDVGDYVDFYSSIEHATTIGRVLCTGAGPLTPHYHNIPIGYHGRSST